MNLGRFWNRFWFAAGRPEDLALSRILFAGGMLLFALSKSIHHWSNVPVEYLRAASFFNMLGIPVASSAVVALLEQAWRLSLFTLAIGLFTRTSAAAACLLGLYVLGIDAPERLGHSFPPLVFIPGILAVARSGDALSVDAFLARRRGRALPESPEEYGWPRKLVCVFLAYVFFAAGVAKVKNTGFPAWALSDMTYRTLLVGNYWYTSRLKAPYPIGPLLLQASPYFGVALGILTQLAELLYPLALFSRRASWVLLPLMLALMTGIALSMGPFFQPTMLAHVFWVPWSEVIDRLRARFRRSRLGRRRSRTGGWCR